MDLRLHPRLYIINASNEVSVETARMCKILLADVIRTHVLYAEPNGEYADLSIQLFKLKQERAGWFT